MKGNFKTKAARLKQGRGWDETNRVENEQGKKLKTKDTVESKRQGWNERTWWKRNEQSLRKKGGTERTWGNWHVKEISDTKTKFRQTKRERLIRRKRKRNARRQPFSHNLKPSFPLRNRTLNTWTTLTCWITFAASPAPAPRKQYVEQIKKLASSLTFG